MSHLFLMFLIRLGCDDDYSFTLVTNGVWRDLVTKTVIFHA